MKDTTKYRIDRVPAHYTTVPCGMNKLLWIGESLKRAHCTIEGLYCEIEEKLILSEWSQVERDYKIIRTITGTGSQKS